MAPSKAYPANANGVSSLSDTSMADETSNMNTVNEDDSLVVCSSASCTLLVSNLHGMRVYKAM